MGTLPGHKRPINGYRDQPAGNSLKLFPITLWAQQFPIQAASGNQEGTQKVLRVNRHFTKKNKKCLWNIDVNWAGKDFVRNGHRMSICNWASRNFVRDCFTNYRCEFGW